MASFHHHNLIFTPPSLLLSYHLWFFLLESPKICEFHSNNKPSLFANTSNLLSLMVTQSGDVVASGGGSSLFLFYFSAVFLLSVSLYLFHFFLLWFFFCSSFTLLFVSVLFCSSRLQCFFLSPTNSLLYVRLCCFPLYSPFFTSLPPPLFPPPKLSCSSPSLKPHLFFSLLSHRLLKGVFIWARGAGATLPLYSHEDRVEWLRRPLYSRPKLPAGHGSHALSMMVAGHEGRGFMWGFGQVGRERERENVGEQNFFFPCCTSKGRRSMVSFKTTLFCASFFF